MFSKALATLFTGRSIEIRVYPLSFKEYYEYHESINTKLKTTEIFSKYMKYGGLPVLLGVVNNDDKMEKVLQKVFDDSVQVDIEQRHMIRTEFFYKIAEYIFLQVGQPISVNNIANFLKSNNNSKTNFKTIMRYIE
jgi:predicted AAA+ superfamily ATPase